MKINNNTITADEGMVLRRISDGLLFGNELSLGYTYYINNTLLVEPLLEKPSDYEEISIDNNTDSKEVDEQEQINNQNNVSVETTEELQPYVDDIINKITEYDSSDEVNCFYLNDTKQWLPVGVRNTYKSSIEAAELLGDDEISFVIGNNIFTIDTKSAKLMLAQLQRYADTCYLVTTKHKLEVSELKSSKDIKNYNYKSGYPDKLIFKL